LNLLLLLWRELEFRLYIRLHEDVRTHAHHHPGTARTAWASLTETAALRRAALESALRRTTLCADRNCQRHCCHTHH